MPQLRPGAVQEEKEEHGGQFPGSLGPPATTPVMTPGLRNGGAWGGVLNPRASRAHREDPFLRPCPCAWGSQHPPTHQCAQGPWGALAGDPEGR